jgi:hypothetical protein
VRNAFRRTGAVLIVAVTLLTAASPAARAAVPESSLAAVIGYDAQGEGVAAALGFLIGVSDDGEQYIVTMDMSAQNAQSYKVFPRPSDQSASADVSLLFQSSRFKAVLLLPAGQLSGMAVPRYADTSALSAGQNMQTVTLLDDGSYETISGKIDSLEDNGVAVTFDSEIGFLGAPLFLEDGGIIGMIVARTEGNRGAAVFAHVLIDDLVGGDNTGGSGSQGSSPPSGGGSDTNDPAFWESLGGKIGGALIAAAIALIGLYIGKKRRKKSAPPQADTWTPPPLQPDAEIVAATPVGVTQPAPPQPSSSARRLTGIRGTGGQYNIMAFPVKDCIAIGRDPERCNIIFAPQTNGVSSRHCEIVRVGDGLQLVDRGSSYGTFVGGAKLSANVPSDLRAGDAFYLGDKRNSFVVY